MKSDYKVHWIERDRQWAINYKRLDGTWSTKAIPRDDIPSRDASEEASRYGGAWYDNYCRNAGIVRGFQPPAQAEATTQTEWDTWIEARDLNPNIKAATVKQNKGHKTTIFGHPMSLKPIRSLMPTDAKDFVIYGRDRNGPKAAYTVRNLINSYSAFLGGRMELAANPFHHGAVRAELPPPKPRWGRDKPHLAPEHITRFLTCEDPAIPKWRWVKYSLAVLGGAREGELQGLLWRYVFLDAEIAYYGLVQQLAFESKKGYAQLDDLKTDSSFRFVPLHPLALARLRWWWEHGWMAWVGRAPTAEDFVFPNEKGKSWRPKAASYLRQDLGAARVPIHYNGYLLTEHALRRSFSTLMHKAGVPTPTITEILGHSDGSTAMDHYIFRYLHPHAEAIRRIQLVEGSA
jgi:integrase